MKNKGNQEKKQYDRSQVVVKIIAGFLAVLMIVGTGITLVYALMG